MIIIKRACFLLMMLSIGCSHQTSYQRLVAMINDPKNKIVQTIQVGNVTVTAKLLPYQYRNNQPGHPPPLEDYTYFNVRFDKHTTEKPAKDKVMYLDFDMQNDFTMLCSRDSVAPSICQKIETGIAGRYEYLVAFDNGNNCAGKNDITLFYKDKIFGLGVVAFVYNQKDIRKVLNLAEGLN